MQHEALTVQEHGYPFCVAVYRRVGYLAPLSGLVRFIPGERAYLYRLQEPLTAAIPEVASDREVVEIVGALELLRGFAKRSERLRGDAVLALALEVVLWRRCWICVFPERMRGAFKALRFERVVEAAIGLGRDHEVRRKEICIFPTVACPVGRYTWSMKASDADRERERTDVLALNEFCTRT